MRRLIPLVAVAGLGAAATALAQGGSSTTDPYQLPEPSLTSSQVLHLPTARCSSHRTATVRVTPPPGGILGFVTVRVRGTEAARLTGVPRAASATVVVPFSGGRVSVTAETLGGQRLRSARVYGDCRTPAAPLPPVVGGGEG